MPESPTSILPEAPAVSRGCPTDDDLLAFIPGLLPDDGAAAVSAHLQTCGVCQSRVTTLKKRLSRPNDDPSDQPEREVGSEPTIPRTAYRPRQMVFPKKLGQYELLHAVGRGGMGVVFKAIHPRLQRHVAIKLLPGLQLSEQTAIVRLQRETAAAGKVAHDNVVYAFDAGEQEGIDYLVMEFVEGIDLSHLVAAIGPLPIAEACEIGRQAALGLAHIESRGLVHRDIKPSNLMLSRDGVVKILDLGLARLREGRLDDAEATHSGFLLGTADYVAPEQIENPRSADLRSDLYSLGCTLFRLLTGRAPFGDEEHSSVTRKLDGHRREPPPAVTALRPEVPKQLAALVGQLLEKDPARRPQHAAEIAAELAAWTGSADLPALAARGLARSDLETLPAPSHSQTPPHHEQSTHTQGRTPTHAQLPAAGRSSRIVWLLAAATVVALVALALRFAPIGGYAGSPSAIEDGNDSVSAASGVELSDELLAAARPIPLMPRDQVQHAHYDVETKELHLSSAGKQLVVLGNLAVGEGTIACDLDFTDDLGDAGLFFGRQDDVRDGERGMTAHLLYLSVFEPRAEPATFRLWRMQGLIRSSSDPPHSFIGRFEDLPLDGRTRTCLLELAYTPKGIVSIKLNGRAHPQLLSTDNPEQEFDPDSLWGEWGIYNDGATLRISNLRVSSHVSSQKGSRE